MTFQIEILMCIFLCVSDFHSDFFPIKNKNLLRERTKFFQDTYAYKWNRTVPNPMHVKTIFKIELILHFISGSF